MSKRCIRPLVAADVALSSRLPAPGAGAGNAAIRTGDRMVPPAAHFESLPPGCRSSFRPRRRAICTVSVDDRRLSASARTGGATGSASPASGLPFCASAAAFRGSDCIRRSALRRITASGHDPPEYARIRFPERRSEKRHPLRPRRRAICTVSVDDRRLSASARTGDRMVPPAAHSESLPPGCRSALRLPPFAVRSRTAPSSRPCAASIAGAPPAGG